MRSLPEQPKPDIPVLMRRLWERLTNLWLARADILRIHT